MVATQQFRTMTSSESNEYYTPSDVIEDARYVMGSIELDVASNELAQSWIKARRYYTKQDDGFFEEWIAETLWMNPPYGQKNKKKDNHGAGAWLTKLYNEYCKGNVKRAIALARGDSEGLKLLMRNFLFCECDRISFLDEKGEIRDLPVPGTKIFCLGADENKFIERFSKRGILLRTIK